VQLFVNTTDHEQTRELLGTAPDVREWLTRHVRDPGRVGAAGAARTRALREALRELVGTEAHSPRAEVEEAARRAKLTVSLAPPRLVSQAEGLDGVLGDLVAIAYEAMRDGSWSRLKACRNCRFLFWDASRNRSAAWCSMQLCGNRQKVRRHRRRARRLEASGQASA
jgi:predicted RNA-binding Zn ribbon-like protein